MLYVHFCHTCFVGVDRGVPNPCLCPPPLSSLPFPSLPPPSPSPPFLSSHNISPTHIEKDSSHHITFHFSGWIIFNNNTKALTGGVCLIVSPFIYLFVLEFNNLNKGPVDNIVVRSSRLPGESEKKRKKAGQMREKNTTSRHIQHLLQRQQVFALL